MTRRPRGRLIALPLSLAVALSTPALASAATATTGDVPGPVVFGLADQGAPISFLNPRAEPYDVYWSVANAGSMQDVLVHRVTLQITDLSIPACVDNVALTTPSETFDDPIRLRAGEVGNPDAEVVEPWVLDDALTFTADSNECMGVSFDIVPTIEYTTVAPADAVTGTGDVLAAGTPVTTAPAGTPLTLRATFALAAVDGVDYEPPSGTVQFVVDGAPYGDPVPLSADGTAELPADLAVGDHAVTAALTDPVYGTILADLGKVRISAARPTFVPPPPDSEPTQTTPPTSGTATPTTPAPTTSGPTGSPTTPAASPTSTTPTPTRTTTPGRATSSPRARRPSADAGPRDSGGQQPASGGGGFSSSGYAGSSSGGSSYATSPATPTSSTLAATGAPAGVAAVGGALVLLGVALLALGRRGQASRRGSDPAQP